MGGLPAFPLLDSNVFRRLDGNVEQVWWMKIDCRVDFLLCGESDQENDIVESSHK